MTLSELWDHLSSGAMRRQRDREREQQAMALSRGNGYNQQFSLADLMAGSDRYGRYMQQLGEDDWMRIKDNSVSQNTEKDMGEAIPDYFWQRYWLNQNMENRALLLSKKYKGGI